MDIATIVGLSLCISAVLGSILVGGDIIAFLDIPSILVVGVGVAGVTFTKWPLEIVVKVAAMATKAVFFTAADLRETIEEIGRLAETARRESVFALEKQPISDSFMKKAMTLAADNRPPEVIHSVLQLEIDSLEKRHQIGITVFKTWPRTGPPSA